ncbi:TetR/AcrR family transcriptional regulator [Kineococcus aurantiacus]|uniref:AcrR family transcriptional regulator n=1 Tax=Kineococcus aurantiacus TaxID=37633 RepID=A0A7Y9DML3_9ACTN|nr:TetR/AcrR family transcriptional regulator [Kineococcus aurantiacus]NYD23323.1 AcrR family transcriptional regulator [Kineococcus aurantiacus]
MARWAPGSGERLQAAALELFAEQGYDQTTVSQIAERAGVTDRTFFRHFADKREALFAGSDRLLAMFTDAVENSPATDPVQLAADALEASAGFFPAERRPWARQRAAVVEAHPALAEREQLKMATLAQAVAAALRGRGVGEPAASLLAHSTTTVFQVAFETWVREGEERAMPEVLHETFAELRATLAPPARA